MRIEREEHDGLATLHSLQAQTLVSRKRESAL